MVGFAGNLECKWQAKSTFPSKAVFYSIPSRLATPRKSTSLLQDFIISGEHFEYGVCWGWEERE